MPEGPASVCPRCAAAFLKADPTEAPESAGATRPFKPPTVADLAPLFPQLEILELIGQGGMGAVYKARQKDLDRIVALKILPPDIGSAAFAERFAREARALARLNHPGIVAIYEFGRADGLYFFLMEFVDGVTLRQVLAAGRLSSREALAIVPEICDALQYAHDQGIVHRDIKPENILLNRRGRLKVADFGLAKLMENDGAATASNAGQAAASSVSQSGSVLGTPSYMAPEQAGNPAAVDHRADIYALGVVFYQMLTGELPAQRLEPPSRKVHIDVRLDEIVLRALEEEPDRRYQQASQVKTAVETVALNRHALRHTGRGVVAGFVAGLAAVLVVSAITIFTKRHAAHPVSQPVKETPSTATVPAENPGILNCYAVAESSNMVAFQVSEDHVQQLVRTFDAHKPIPVDVFDRQDRKFGHGFLTGLDNKLDSATATLRCHASITPDDGNIMLPGLYLNARVYLNAAAASETTGPSPSSVDWLKIQPLTGWISDLQSSDEKTKATAETAMREMGATALPDILEGLSQAPDAPTSADTEHYNMAMAVKYLSAGVKPHLPQFVRLMESGHQGRAYAAAAALSACAPDVPEAFDILLTRLANQVVGTRDAATYGIGLCLGTVPNDFALPALPLVISNLQSEADYLRSDSVVALMIFTQRQCQNSKPVPDYVVASLIPMLHDKFHFARFYASVALNNSCLIPRLKPYLPELQKLTNDPDSEIRQIGRQLLISVNGH